MGPLIFAFSAGMVATVNPCGFAMLPAYISLFLTEDESKSRSGLVRGLAVGGWVTVGFIATFSVVGAVVRLASSGIIRLVPWAAVVIGVVLVVLGIAVLAGRHLTLKILNVRFTRARSPKSMAAFGVAYGVASISCTLPVFLSVATVALATSNVTTGALTFAMYGLGMGMVLMGLAVAVATSRDAVADKLRRLLPYVDRIGGWLLIASGLFIVYYWVTALTVPVTESDAIWYRPILIVDRVSAWFTREIASNTAMWVIVLLSIVGVVAAYEQRRRRRMLEAVEAAERRV